ncbi:MAG: hypothetical protein ACR2JH_04390 [Solirubrobacteraceae bacterium]
MIRLRDIPARLFAVRPDEPERERPAHLSALSAALMLAGIVVLVVALVVALA